MIPKTNPSDLVSHQNLVSLEPELESHRNRARPHQNHANEHAHHRNLKRSSLRVGSRKWRSNMGTLSNKTVVKDLTLSDILITRIIPAFDLR